MGQSYAMDRSGRWDRVHKAYAAIVRGEAKTKETPYEALQAAYQAKQTDGNVEPTRIGEYEGMVGSFMADFASGQSADTTLAFAAVVLLSGMSILLFYCVALVERFVVPWSEEQA